MKKIICVLMFLFVIVGISAIDMYYDVTLGYQDGLYVLNNEIFDLKPIVFELGIYAESDYFLLGSKYLRSMYTNSMGTYFAPATDEITIFLEFNYNHFTIGYEQYRFHMVQMYGINIADNYDGTCNYLYLKYSSKER